MVMRSGVGSSVVSGTGVSERTQASPVLPPRCRLTARASISCAIRTKPPGMTRHPSTVRARNSRNVNGRGSSRPLRQTGGVERATASLATKSMPRWLSEEARPRVGLEPRTETLALFAVPGQLAEKSRCDDHLVEPMDDLMAGLRLTEPRGRNVRQRKWSAQQRRRQRRQKTEQRPSFDEARAERIGDHDGTVARRLHQARHAETRARVELERIREIS